MLSYTARRFVYTLIVLVIASMVIFVSLRIAPGQPEDTLYNPMASATAKNALRHQLGLDQPIVTQYITFVRKVLQGDLGVSIRNGETIPQLLRTYGPNSLELILAAVVLIYGLAIPLGALAAARRDSWIDHVVMACTNLGMGIPNFLLALVLIRILALQLGWLPLSGAGGLRYVIMPAICLSAEGISVALRLVRSSMLEQLQQDYVRTLRAKGLNTFQIVWQHALRNALIPVISLSALQIGALVGYTAIVEIVFRWPGLGYLLVNSVLQRDYPVALMLSLLLTTTVVLANFAANVAYAWVDPRIRASMRRAA